MGIRTFIVVGLVFVAASVRAGTNNTWISSATDYWDSNGAWSLGAAPSGADLGDFITNAVNKTVIIDDFISANEAGELTISNLTVSGAGTTTNTLSLANMNAGAAIPLHILNLLTLGANGQLQMTNSMLRAANASISPGAILKFAVGSSFTAVVVDNNLALAGILNVTNGGGFTNTTYTLFTYGGALAYSGLTVGLMPSNFLGVVDTVTVGQVKLVVSQVPPPPSGGFQITSIVRSANDILLTWTAANSGSYTVQALNGGTNGFTGTNGFQDISGSLAVTVTNYMDVGGATNTPTRYYRIHLVQ